MKIVSVAEMQAVERAADLLGLSYAQMLENAGEALAAWVERELGARKEMGVLGLVGPGNNGGDTLVALTRLLENGWTAAAWLMLPRRPDDPYLERFQAAGGLVHLPSTPPEILLTGLTAWGVLLDGLLGTGFHLPEGGARLSQELGAALNALRAALAEAEPRPLVIAVDCPSGVDCDSGALAPETLPADATVTMAAVKQGLLRFPAAEFTGALHRVSIGLEKLEGRLPEWDGLTRATVEAAQVRALLPARPLSAHKGTFGSALIVAGSLDYPGAALLAAEGAYRSGAGLVTLATVAHLQASLAARLPEATWLLLPEQEGGLAAEAAALLQEALQGERLSRTRAALLGPGLGQAEGTRRFLERLLTVAPKPRPGLGFLPGARPKHPGPRSSFGYAQPSLPRPFPSQPDFEPDDDPDDFRRAATPSPVEDRHSQLPASSIDELQKGQPPSSFRQPSPLAPSSPSHEGPSISPCLPFGDAQIGQPYSHFGDAQDLRSAFPLSQTAALAHSSPAAAPANPPPSASATSTPPTAPLDARPSPISQENSPQTASGPAQLPPLVLDADALNLLAQMPDWPSHLPPNCLLTPHPGEMARLSGWTTEAVQQDRLHAAAHFSREWGQVVLLKGAFSVIAAPDGRLAVLPIATPALARAGTGDVLAGIATGLRAQGLEAFEAGLCAAWLHAQAGLIASERLGGPASVLASDVLAALPAALSALQRSTL